MDMKQRLDAVVDSAIAGGTIVGAVTLVARNGDLAYARAAGFFDREAGMPMREDAIFRIASVTKPLVAATALALLDSGRLRLDDSVADHLHYFQPRLADGSAATIRIRHLLTHTSGLGGAYPGDPLIDTGLRDTDLGLDETLARIAALPLSFAPGSAWQYGVSVDVLGAVIARIENCSLGEAVAHHITGPLGMPDTGFAVTDPSRLAVPYADARPEPLRMRDPHIVENPTEGGVVTFSPGRIFNPKAYHSGGAGAVGTAGDLLKFFEALRRGGAPILKPETMQMAGRNQIGDLPRDIKDAGQRFGFLGAVLADPLAAASPQSPGTINWGGIYGHSWSVDPANGLSIVALTNTAVEGCVGKYPKDIRDAVYG